MELPSAQARKLMGDYFPWIDDYYLESIPEEVTENPGRTICLIQETINEPDEYGYANRTFKRWMIGVEVQIFYKQNADVSSLDEEMRIARLFVADNWKVEQSKNHVLDPDTKQVTKVFYFSKILNIKE